MSVSFGPTRASVVQEPKNSNWNVFATLLRFANQFLRESSAHQYPPGIRVGTLHKRGRTSTSRLIWFRAVAMCLRIRRVQVGGAPRSFWYQALAAVRRRTLVT